MIAALQEESRKGKIISAICAAPIVLARAGLLKDKHYTCYDGFEERDSSWSLSEKETVVKDGNLLTSRGPSTALALAYALVEQFGGDAQSLRQRNALSRCLWRCLKELFWTPYFSGERSHSMTGNDFSMI